MPSTPKPYFTVIIPARNEEAYIDKAIASIKQQDWDQAVELLVVDNASIDGTAKIAKKLGAGVVTEKRVGLPQTRETGRLAAHGEILVYLDADTVLPVNYLNRIAQVFQSQSNTVGVSNPFTFYDGTATHHLVINFFFKVVFPLQNLLLRILGKSHQLLGGSFAVRSDTLVKLGGFNTKIIFAGEDLAISKALSKFGEIILLPDIRSQTSARRFQANGTIRTCGVYFKNFFSVLLVNKSSDGTLIRKALKITLLLIVFLVIIKNLHLLHFLMQDPDVTALVGSIIMGTITVYGIFHPQSLLFGPIISKFDAHEKLVALTFDDGPNPISTVKVLDILRREKIPASFFVVGKNAATHPELLTTMIKDGHIVGNHSYRHRWVFPFLSSNVIKDDVEKTESIIQSIVGSEHAPKIFRPPHGWHTPWMLSQLTKKGYKVINWTVSLDYIPGTTAQANIKHYSKKTRPGSILLFHDSIWENPNNDRGNLIDALPAIIKHLKSQGYRFVLVTDML